MRLSHPLGSRWQWLLDRGVEGQAGRAWSLGGREEGPREAANGGTMSETSSTVTSDITHNTNSKTELLRISREQLQSIKPKVRGCFRVWSPE